MQGASTLTQQLARSGLLGIGNEVTYTRKIKEALYAVLIEARYDKRTILETYLNQVYIGMFRPDELAFPRWAGNLKQYRLGLVNGALRLLDAQEPAQPAISSAGTGFISSCARSYWTPPSNDACG